MYVGAALPSFITAAASAPSPPAPRHLPPSPPRSSIKIARGQARPSLAPSPERLTAPSRAVRHRFCAAGAVAVVCPPATDLSQTVGLSDPLAPALCTLHTFQRLASSAGRIRTLPLAPRRRTDPESTRLCIHPRAYSRTLLVARQHLLDLTLLPQYPSDVFPFGRVRPPSPKRTKAGPPCRIPSRITLAGFRVTYPVPSPASRARARGPITSP
jgi:hypothetical protein